MDDTPAFGGDDAGTEATDDPTVGGDHGAGRGAETGVRASEPTDTDATGPPADLVVDVGVLVAHSPGGDADALGSFAERIVGDATDELAAATGVPGASTPRNRIRWPTGRRAVRRNFSTRPPSTWWNDRTTWSSS